MLTSSHTACIGPTELTMTGAHPAQFQVVWRGAWEGFLEAAAGPEEHSCCSRILCVVHGRCCCIVGGYGMHPGACPRSKGGIRWYLVCLFNQRWPWVKQLYVSTLKDCNHAIQAHSDCHHSIPCAVQLLTLRNARELSSDCMSGRSRSSALRASILISMSASSWSIVGQVDIQLPGKPCSVKKLWQVHSL